MSRNLDVIVDSNGVERRVPIVRVEQGDREQGDREGGFILKFGDRVFASVFYSRAGGWIVVGPNREQFNAVVKWEETNVGGKITLSWQQGGCVIWSGDAFVEFEDLVKQYLVSRQRGFLIVMRRKIMEYASKLEKVHSNVTRKMLEWESAAASIQRMSNESSENPETDMSDLGRVRLDMNRKYLEYLSAQAEMRKLQQQIAEQRADIATARARLRQLGMRMDAEVTAVTDGSGSGESKQSAPRLRL